MKKSVWRRAAEVVGEMDTGWSLALDETGVTYAERRLFLEIYPEEIWPDTPQGQTARIIALLLMEHIE